MKSGLMAQQRLGSSPMKELFVAPRTAWKTIMADARRTNGVNSALFNTLVTIVSAALWQIKKAWHGQGFGHDSSSDHLRKEMCKVKSVNWSALLIDPIQARVELERRSGGV